MPKYSAFTPYGLLAFSGATSPAERIHSALRAGVEGGFPLTPDSYEDARLYAVAMGIARAQAALFRAGFERRPRHSQTFLPAHERAYGVKPLASASEDARRAAVDARVRRIRGARTESITEALATALGADFVAYRPTKLTEITTWPSSPGAGPGNYQRATFPKRFFWLLTSAGVGSTAFEYAPFTAGDRLRTGDVLVFDAGNLTLAERTTVTAEPESVTLQATATLTRGHGAGAAIVIGPHPIWTSSKRSALVILASTAAASPEKRRLVNDVMQRYARGISTWATVAAITSTTAGPFRIGVSPLGITPLGVVTFP